MSSPTGILFAGAKQLVTCAGPSRARRGREMNDAAVLAGAAVAVREGNIVEVGENSAMRARYSEFQLVDCSNCIVTPGLVDSHTHALFGAHRAHEQELRAAGKSYMEIAELGGGIHFSVRDLRERTDAELIALTAARLARMASYGTTTVEIKSGYALDVPNELRMLRLIARLREFTPMRLVPTWMGAHEIPLELRGRPGGREEYISLLLNEMLPVVVKERLATFADVFCEPGAFTVEESRAILTAARGAGLAAKIHADELRWSGGAELAAELSATSADHLAVVSDAGIAALSRSGVVATLLPGTMLFLGLDLRAPARRLIEAGAAVALATDFNPGTSPTVNLPLIMSLAVSRLGMTAAESVVGTTVNGAAALGMARKIGQIAPGFEADLAVFAAADYRELPYWYGDRLCRGSWVSGKACHQIELPILS